ncbi:hypothetical protein ACQPYK_21660 [Streptosporangium sp. CA-135522]|uniref:hypothetical protein n=1 Tax=Streptosporangium sp. CA-135522 TaxID=3240072 RepID=UPI003D8DC90C
MPAVDPAVVITRNLGHMLIPGRPYPGELPTELAPWHCYTPHDGHSIMVLLAQFASEGDPEDYIVPLPVKSVLRAGWQVNGDGFIVIDLPYSTETGLVTPPEDDEY